MDSNGNLSQFLSDSWTQSWSSIQGFTSALIPDAGGKGTQSPNRPDALSRQVSNTSTKQSVTWGPPPPTSIPKLGDVATGSKKKRETALKAARTASVLESHDGVNGGLDVAGRHKRRNSDDVAPDRPTQEDFHAYIHNVQPTDSYVGLILRYKCREDAFKRANGLWSRDAVLTRKWLIVPVDACELRGKPCDAPSWHNSNKVDLLAPTPSATTDQRSNPHDDFFSRSDNEGPADARQTTEGVEEEAEDAQPWAHVRWVQVEGFAQPLEIGRVSRQATGYFPPRRRKSIRTISSFSTPRQSVDLSSVTPGSVDGRASTSSGRPRLSSTPRSRGGSASADDRPVWMRRPGGVGSMSRNVRAPGPANDYFNKWSTKHIPGFNMNDLPSMSVMGTETAQFGFNDKDSGALVESAMEDGRDATSASRAGNGNGLDRAAMVVETWLRGALARSPGTPLLAARGRPTGGLLGEADGDLIELTDTASDDGRSPIDGGAKLMGSLSLVGPSGRSNGEGVVRGRAVASGSKSGKAE